MSPECCQGFVGDGNEWRIVRVVFRFGVIDVEAGEAIGDDFEQSPGRGIGQGGFVDPAGVDVAIGQLPCNDGNE